MFLKVFKSSVSHQKDIFKFWQKIFAQEDVLIFFTYGHVLIFEDYEIKITLTTILLNPTS